MIVQRRCNADSNGETQFDLAFSQADMDEPVVSDRIFSYSRSILFWGKKDKANWLLCRRPLDDLRERAERVENKRWEILEDLKGGGLEILMYFESPPSQTVADQVGTFRLLHALVAGRSRG